MTERLEVDAPEPLMAFLRRRLHGWHGKTLKERLRSGCILVNGEVATRHDHPLQAGDGVVVNSRESGREAGRTPGAFTILHSDDDLIAIDKPAGLLSVATDRQRSRTALALVREHISPRGKLAPLWPVHRLDRETSGVLLFARSREMRDAVQSTWAEVQKTYLAIVEGHPEREQGIIDQPLWQDRSLNVHVGLRPGARDARTRYRTRERGPHRALLEVDLETGRRHQIRCHLAWLGHPVVGDRRYGNKGARLGLHALRLRLAHPRGGSLLEFETPPPGAFTALLAKGP